MAFSNVDLRRWNHRRFVIEPYNDRQETPLGYDLRIGYVIDPNTETEIYPNNAHHEDVIDIEIPAKSTVTIVTLERIFLTGKVIGTVHARSGISSKGILVNSVTVDPFWNGRLLLNLYNCNNYNVNITSNKGMATLILHSVESETASQHRKSETKDLLEDQDQRYTPTVANKILEYSHKYEDTEGERRYREARTSAKAYRAKNAVLRYLMRFIQDTPWYRLAYLVTSALVVLSIVLLLAAWIVPDITQLPILSGLTKNTEVIAVIAAVGAFMLSIVTHAQQHLLEVQRREIRARNQEQR